MDASEVAARAWEMRVSMTRVALSIVHHTADAEDAVATALLNAYKSADRLQDEAKLNAWVMRILVRCCYDLLRQRKREAPAESIDAVDAPILENTEGTVLEAIGLLPETLEKVLVLHYYEGFKAREIAHILSIPLGTVVVRLSRGRAKLKQILEMEGVVTGDKQTV